jgi:hypothetical protein
MVITKQQAEEQKIQSSLQNGLKTHCPQGHEYTEENTKFTKGRRYCKQCARDYQKRRYDAKQGLETTGRKPRVKKAVQEQLPTFQKLPEAALARLFKK